MVTMCGDGTSPSREVSIPEKPIAKASSRPTTSGSRAGNAGGIFVLPVCDGIHSPLTGLKGSRATRSTTAEVERYEPFECHCMAVAAWKAQKNIREEVLVIASDVHESQC